MPVHEVTCPYWQAHMEVDSPLDRTPKAGPFYFGAFAKTAQRSLRWANVEWVLFGAEVYSKTGRTQSPEGSNTE